MAGDARFEDGAPSALPGALTLLATDAEDLAVISTLVQDALLTPAQIRYDRRRRRLAVLLNRYCWEGREGAVPEAGPSRVRSLLVIADVLRVQTLGIAKDRTDTILSILSLEHGPDADGTGTLTIQLAGDGALRLEVECIDLVLRDISRPWPASSGRAPAHDRSGAGD